MATFRTFLDQVAALLQKDFLLALRHFCATFVLLLCPSIMLLLLILPIFFVEDPVEIKLYETFPETTAPIMLTSYPFDPFPLSCSEVAAPSTGDIDGEAKAPSWRREAQPKMEGYTNFDCFIDSMALITPFWRNMVQQFRQVPSWKPTKQTFGVVVQGGKDEYVLPQQSTNQQVQQPQASDTENRLSLQMAYYLSTRYEEKMMTTIELFKIFDDHCFKNLTAIVRFNTSDNTASIISANNINGSQVMPSDMMMTSYGDMIMSTDSNGQNTIMTIYDQCITHYPELCLDTCNRGLFYGDQPSNYSGVDVNGSQILIGQIPSTVPQSVMDYPGSFGYRINQLIQNNGGDVRRLFEKGEKDGKKESDSSVVTVTSDTNSNSNTFTVVESDPIDGPSNYLLGRLTDKYHQIKMERDSEVQSISINKSRIRNLKDAAASATSTSKSINNGLQIDPDLEELDDADDVVSEQRSLLNSIFSSISESSTGTMISGPLSYLSSQILGVEVSENNRNLNLKNNLHKHDNNTRNLQSQSEKNCREIKDPCECAKARQDKCAWIASEAEDRLDGRCRQSTYGGQQRDTSCFECPTQWSGPGGVGGDPLCAPSTLWKSVGESLPILKPRIQTFSSESSLETKIRSAHYPKAVSEGVSEQICGAVVFMNHKGTDDAEDLDLTDGDEELANGLGSSDSLEVARGLDTLDVSIRVNGSSPLGTSFRFQPGIRVLSRPSPISLLSYTQSGYLGLQSVVNDFLACDVETSSNKLSRTFCFRKQSSSTATSTPAPVDATQINLGIFGLPAYWNNPGLLALFNEESDTGGNIYFAMCVPLLSLVGKILTEKESRIREGMRMMGLMDSAFYAESVIYHFLLALGAGIIFSVIWVHLIPDFNSMSSGGIMFIYFVVLFWNNFEFATFLSIFFDNAMFGKIAVFGICFITSIIPLLIPTIERDIEFTQRIHLRRVFGILAGCNIRWGLDVWSELEFKLDGVTSSTITQRILRGDTNFSFLDAILTNILGIFIWVIFYVYFDQIIPSEYGVARKWYFIFTKDFWMVEVMGKPLEGSAGIHTGGSQRQVSKESSIHDNMNIMDSDHKNFEADDPNVDKYDPDSETEAASPSRAIASSVGPSPKVNQSIVVNPKSGTTTQRVKSTFEKPTSEMKTLQQEGRVIKVRKLKKVFNVDNRELIAVNDVDLTMYENEIFVLLGHNGAGKTTLFSILTGLIEATSGECSFYGRSLKQQLMTSRDKVGICPQHSVLWPDLTVMEHLMLFATFKGVPRAKARKQARELLREQAMDHAENQLARRCSGGMQRKLSLAISFIGDPTLVFLDEPSSGLDTAARKEILSLIKRRKEGRIICLTTHYMDEADVLADRVAIMSHGKVKANGSPQFLKQVFGCGYNLSFVTMPNVLAENVVGPFTQFLQSPDLFGADNRQTNTAIENEIRDSMDSRETIQNNVNKENENAQVRSNKLIRLMSLAANEMLFLAPFEICPRFERAFSMIEKEKKNYGVRSWGLMVCNLEEVFLKVASEDAAEEARESAANANSSTHDKSTSGRGVSHHVAMSNALSAHITSNEGKDAMEVKGVTDQATSAIPESLNNGGNQQESDQRLHSQATTTYESESSKIIRSQTLNPKLTTQFLALIQKRYLNSKRYFGTTFCQLFCPLFYLLVFVAFIKVSMLEARRLELQGDTHYNLDNDDVNARFRSYHAIRGTAGTVKGQSGINTNSALAKQQSFINDPIIQNLKSASALGSNSHSSLYMSEQEAQIQSCPWLDACQERKRGGSGGGDSSMSRAPFGSDSIYGGCPANQASNMGVSMVNTIGLQIGSLLPTTPYWSTNGMMSGNAYSMITAAGGIGSMFSGGSNSSSQSSSSMMMMGGIPVDASVDNPQSVAAKRRDLNRFDYWMERKVPSNGEDESVYGGYLIGDEIGGDQGSLAIKINGTGAHSAPIYLQLWYDSCRLARALAANPTESFNRIVPYLHILPRTLTEDELYLNSQTFLFGMAVILSFGFVSCFSLVFIVEEKVGEVKIQQYVNGVSIPIYWLSNWCFDVALFIVPIVSVIFVLKMFNVDLLTAPETLGPTLAIMIAFACAMPVYNFLAAHAFRTPNDALSTAIGLNVVANFVLFFAGLIMELFPFTPTRAFIKTFGWIVRFWPPYALSEGVRRLMFCAYFWQNNPPDEMSDKQYNECVEKYNNHEVSPHQCSRNLFDRFGLGPAFISLCINLVLYGSLVVLWDLLKQDVGLRQKLFWWEPPAPLDRSHDQQNLRHLRDESVTTEEERVGQANQDTIVNHSGVYVKALHKTFRVRDVVGTGATHDDDDNGDGGGIVKVGSDGPERKKGRCESCCTWLCPCCQCCFEFQVEKKDIHAVRDVNFLLDRGEVFGLLGQNGAGKTTTFRMMCGVEVASRHPETEIFIGGKNLLTERQECRKVIGYTAQANPLWMSLTVEEHLRFYARVKGVESSQIEILVQAIIDDMDLFRHKHKRAGNLSGGNKRKLVIAMSLIGSPPVLFLDEPSCGMDPDARRRMWSIIQKIATRTKQSSVILTTHSMEECEALCSRVCIMRSGVFRTIGTLGDIKESYGTGYDLYIKLKDPQSGSLKRWALHLEAGKTIGQMTGSGGGISSEQHSESGVSINTGMAGQSDASTAATTGATGVQTIGNAANIDAIRETAIQGFEGINLEEAISFRDFEERLRRKGIKISNTVAGTVVSNPNQNQSQNQSQNQIQVTTDLTPAILIALHSRSSAFPAASRLALKPEEFITPEEHEEVLDSRSRWSTVLVWLAQSIQMIMVETWVMQQFPGSFRVESRGSGQSTYRIFGTVGSGNGNSMGIGIDSDDDDNINNMDSPTSSVNGDASPGRQTQKLGKQKILLGKLFGKVENVKNKYRISEYAITPTTLEQIFNMLSQDMVLGTGVNCSNAHAMTNSMGPNLNQGTNNIMSPISESHAKYERGDSLNVTHSNSQDHISSLKRSVDKGPAITSSSTNEVVGAAVLATDTNAENENNPVQDDEDFGIKFGTPRAE